MSSNLFFTRHIHVLLEPNKREATFSNSQHPTPQTSANFLNSMYITLQAKGNANSKYSFSTLPPILSEISR